MHHMVIVVGDDVESQMDGLTSIEPPIFCDWWMIGGRWVDSLRLLTGEWVDQARIGDIDLSALYLPSAVVMGGEVVLEKYSPLEQAQAVLKHLEALPADTLLTVLDVHG
jgi:hypothetical protein